MLELNNIHFAHRKGKELFGGFSLTVEPGERVALTAPSGAGKTTFCSIAAGYAKPKTGSVLVDGKPLPKQGVCPVQMIWQHPERVLDPLMRMKDALAEAGLNASEIEAALADSPSKTFATSGTVVAHPADSLYTSATSNATPTANQNSHLLQELGIRPEWLSRFPHELSGGELQRFCIARALAANPRYLIADEISTMLDAYTQAQLWHFLLEEAEKRNLGMIVVTHSPALLERIATRVVSLPEG